MDNFQSNKGRANKTIGLRRISQRNMLKSGENRHRKKYKQKFISQFNSKVIKNQNKEKNYEVFVSKQSRLKNFKKPSSCLSKKRKQLN